MNLLETYSKRLKVSEAFYNKKNADGSKMSNHQKLTIARVLANTSAFLNESFTSASGTQRADLGTYKKFCLDL